MRLTPIDYEAAGVTLRGYFAGGPGDARPGVLVAHEAPGVGPHVQQRATMLAHLGYGAFALDLYGGEPFPFEQTAGRHNALMASPGLMLARARAALDVLAAQPGVDCRRLAAIGFCQGGITVMELARGGAPVQCVVGFHPGLMRPAGSPDGPIAAKILMLVGEDDPVIPPTDRDAFVSEMKDKKADWQLHLFGGVGHSFTNPEIDDLKIPGFAYDAVADRRAWAMMTSLLAETFATA